MVCRGATLEDTLEALDKLRGDDYLGHEHHYVAPRGQSLGNKVYVYLGLPRACDAVKQRDKAVAVCRVDKLQGAVLSLGELR